MNGLLVFCTHCGKQILRRKGWIKENIKLKQRNYCSLKCLGKSRILRIKLICENSICKKKFERVSSSVSPHNYCSRRCMMIVNNSKFPRRIAKVRLCAYCGKQFKFREKYCSKICKDKDQVVSGVKIINWIKDFYKTNGRIPFKKEYGHNHAARLRFGSWNEAIKMAGLDPNPVMFAKKFIANDGHKCDSLSEKIIDDWLYARNVKHQINYPYPGNDGFTADFKVGKYWIEFFGLSGQHKRYDELKVYKMNIAKLNKLKIIQIYPEDIFPKSRLDVLLEKLSS